MPKSLLYKTSGKAFPSLFLFPEARECKIFLSLLFLNIKLHFKKIKCPFCIFHWGRNVLVPLLGSIKAVNFKNAVSDVKTTQIHKYCFVNLKPR